MFDTPTHTHSDTQGHPNTLTHARTHARTHALSAHPLFQRQTLSSSLLGENLSKVDKKRR
eukprot:2983744-Rhodomonas_salina.1